MANQPETSGEYLSLKWGTIKAWNFTTQKSRDAAKVYAAFGMSLSAMAQHDSPEQKQALCDLIDVVDCEMICLDWDGKMVTKEAAKEYVMTYGTEVAK